MTLSIDGQININPCTGEGVELFGDLQIVERLESDGNGGVHQHTTVAAKGLRGIGLESGIQYVVNGPGPVFTNNFSVDGASVSTAVISSRMIAPGPEDDFSISLLLHTTIDADGILTATIVDSSTECRG